MFWDIRQAIINAIPAGGRSRSSCALPGDCPPSTCTPRRATMPPATRLSLVSLFTSLILLALAGVWTGTGAQAQQPAPPQEPGQQTAPPAQKQDDNRSEERRVGKRVDHGGRRNNKNTKKTRTR